VRQVAERPQPFVGEAVVVALFLLGRQPDTTERVGLLAGRHRDPVVLVDGLAIRRAAAVRDPDARASAQHGLDRGHEAARGVLDLDGALGGAVVDVGLAVGEDDDLLPREVADQGLLELLRAPAAPLAVHLALGGDALDQLAHVADDRQELLAV